MKYFRLLSLAACFALLGGAAHAQILQNHAKSHVIFVNTGGEKLDSAATEQVIAAYYNTIERGFQQSGLPRFIISGKDQKMILGIGGNVSLRASYDFGGIADNLDFITADIPVPNTERYNQQFQLDPSTSGLFFKAIAHAGKLGPIVGYISANFRGYQTTGFSLRDAYITVAGFTVGRRFTTFCDLTAVPTTVDFEGPNGYTTLFNTMIRYTHTFNAHWQIAVAAEMPDASITTSAATGTTTQRMPDFPVYVQYSWNKGMSHVRASALFRDLDYYNERLDSRESQFGYGVQVSGEWQLGRKWTAYWQGIYGKGVAGYIQDIAGTGLDLVPVTGDPGKLQAVEAGSWIGGLQYVFNKKWTATAAYSGVKVAAPKDYYQADLYNLAHYVSTNVFYNITDSFQAGLSYMYGSRKNLDGQLGHANRIQALVQYNF